MGSSPPTILAEIFFLSDSLGGATGGGFLISVEHVIIRMNFSMFKNSHHIFDCLNSKLWSPSVFAILYE